MRDLVANLFDTAAAAQLRVTANTIVGSPWSWDYGIANARLAGVDLTEDVAVAASALADVEADGDSIGSAVITWETEQARIAAEKAEQERLAQVAAQKAAEEAAAAAERASRRNVPAPPANASAGTAAGIDVHVRTSVNAAGQVNGQAEIDAGGQVAVNWPGVGTFVSAHNHNDSRALNLRPGDIVRFSGAVTGTWRVTGSMDVRKGDGPQVVLPLGTSMFMQTCYFSSAAMRVVGLVPA